jgi:hypothetical protein
MACFLQKRSLITSYKIQAIKKNMTSRIFYIICRPFHTVLSLVSIKWIDLYTKTYKPKRLLAWIGLCTLYRKGSFSNDLAERTEGYGESRNLFYRWSCLSFNNFLIFPSLKFLTRMTSLLGVSCVCSWLVGKRAYFLQTSCLKAFPLGTRDPYTYVPMHTLPESFHHI